MIQRNRSYERTADTSWRVKTQYSESIMYTWIKTSNFATRCSILHESVTGYYFFFNRSSHHVGFQLDACTPVICQGLPLDHCRTVPMDL